MLTGGLEDLENMASEMKAAVVGRDDNYIEIEKMRQLLRDLQLAQRKARKIADYITAKYNIQETRGEGR